MILLLCYCFLGVLEWRIYALPEIVPLSRALFVRLRDVLPLIGMRPMREIFHEIHVRLFSRFMINNREEAVAAYSLTMQGRWEIPEFEKGCRTQEPDELTPSPLTGLKSL
jgi:hypothetical protein